MFGCQKNNSVLGTLHYATECDGDLYNDVSGVYPNVTAGQPAMNFSTGYHEFAVEWNSTQINWYVDDVFYKARYPGDYPAPFGAIIPQTPFYFILNTAILWWDAPYPLPPPLGLAEVYHYIDYVRAYQYVPDTSQ